MKGWQWLGAVLLLLPVAGNAVPEAAPAPKVSLRSASIVMKVPAFPQARERVLQMTRDHQGLLLDARTRVKPNGDQYGTLVVQAPRAEMDALLHDVRGVGKLYGDNVQTRDRTSEFELLGRRTALLQQNETELLNFLHSPRRMRGSDILYVQYRLYQTRMEMAQAEQVRQNLLRGDGRSTVNITLFEAELPGAFHWRDWWGRQAGKVGVAFFTGLRTFVNLLLGLIASWPTLLILGILGWLGWRLWRKWWKRAEAA